MAVMHARSNADMADCLFTGRLTAEPKFEEAKQKKNKTFAPYISISLVSNAHPYSNNHKCFSYLYCWGKLSTKINAMDLVAGDGVWIQCRYESRTVEEKGVKFNAASFEIKRLYRISFAKVKDELEHEEESDVDTGAEIV